MAVQEVQLVNKSLAAKTAWFSKALHEGTFDQVYCLLDEAVVVSCIALLLLWGVLCCAVLCCAVLCCAAALCCAVMCFCSHCAMLQTPAPWDTERCVAVARVMTAGGDLRDALPGPAYDKVRTGTNQFNILIRRLV